MKLPTMVVTLAVLFLGVTRVALSADAQWPRFRGPGGSGVADESGVPVEFGPNKNVVWKIAVPEGHSSPVIWGDRIFLTAFDRGRLETLCINRQTGKVLWNKAADELKNLTKGHPANSRASPSPATDGQRVYVYFGALGLVAYDFQGNEQWRFPVPEVKQPWGVGTSPIIAGNLVLLNFDDDLNSFLIALDRETGKPVWKTERAEFRRGFSTPLVLEHENQVVVAGSLRVTAYDLKDGHEVWTVNGMPYQVSPSPVFADGTIYIAAWDSGAPVDNFDQYLRFDKNNDDQISPEELNFGGEFPKYDRNKDGQITREEFNGFAEFYRKSRPRLLAIQPGGKGDVSKTHIKWEALKALPHISTVLVYRGLVYTIQHGAILTCYDAKSGETEFQARIPARGQYFSSPVANDGKVYLASRNGTVVVVNAGPKLDILATNKLGEPITATPAIVDSTLYLRTAGHLYAFADRSRQEADLVVDLNHHRETLQDTFQHNFATNGLPNDRFAAWGIADATKQTEAGVRTVVPGADPQATATLDLKRSLRGDFDVILHVQMDKLEESGIDGALSGVNLNISLGQDKSTTCIMAYGKTPDGFPRVYSRMLTIGSNGKRSFRPLGRFDLSTLDRLRFVRRGTTIYYFCAASGSEDFHLLSQQETTTDDVPSRGVRMFVRTYGTGRETIVTWKQLDIRAEEIRMTEKAANRNPKRK